MFLENKHVKPLCHLLYLFPWRSCYMMIHAKEGRKSRHERHVFCFWCWLVFRLSFLGECIKQNPSIWSIADTLLVMDSYLTECITFQKAFLFLSPSLNQALQSFVLNAVVQFEELINVTGNTDCCYYKEDIRNINCIESHSYKKLELCLVWWWWLALAGSCVSAAQQ